MAEAGEDEDLIVTLGEPPPELAASAADSSAAVSGAAASNGAVATKPPPVPGPGTAPAQASRDDNSSQQGVRDLEAQLAAERAERNRLAQVARKAQTDRDQALRYAQEAEQRGGTNYEAYVDSQIQGMTEQMDSLTAQAEAAMGDGDFKTVAEINKRLGRIGGVLAIAEREKLALQQQREQQQRQPRQPQQQPQQQPHQPVTYANPLEKAIAGRSEPTKNFLRKHPELVRSDGTLKAMAVQAHERALDDGHTADTPAYFDYIEKTLGTANGAANTSSENGAKPAVQIPGYSAPVTRGPGPGSSSDGLQPGTFRMTPKMRRLADEQGVSPQEWANNYVKLLKEGRITPIT